jgi:uracil-DNA glycosylase family 4
MVEEPGVNAMGCTSPEWRSLINEILNCKKCPLYKTRRNPVPGEGKCDAALMFVGEAPGAREDETGRPFVGAAGKLLDQLLGQIGVSRKEVYITNVVKCRPPNNRDPTLEEIKACSPYLLRQIQLIKPKIIVALGRHSARFLYEQAGLTWRSMRVDHGRVREAVIMGLPVKLIATYHPAAALYYPKLKPLLEEDFKKIGDLLSSLKRNVKKGHSILDYI